MIFSPEWGLNPAKIQLLTERLVTRRLVVKAQIPKPDGSYQIIIDTMLEAHTLMPTLGAKGCILCSGCQTMHYKIEQHLNDPFVCPCGKLLNKPKK